MESVKDPLLQLLSSHLQETFDTMKQCILDLVERSQQGLEPQGGSLEPLRTPSDADEPVAPHSMQESVVKIKETDMVLKEDALHPEPEGPGPPMDSTSDSGRSDKERQHAERTFLCDVCGKLFQRKWNLTSHQRVHTGERPYPCDICSKSFNDSGVLKRHKLIHTGERPYSCNVCAKPFKQKGDLKKHKRVHTGERPYSCDVCKKTFKLNDHLKTHKLIHTGERPYPCDVCAKSFTQNGHLKTHKYVHTGERPYACNVCEKSFRRRNEVNRHQRIHHKIHFSGTEPGKGEPTESGET